VETAQQAWSVALVLALLGGGLWWLRRKGVAYFASGPRSHGKGRSMRVVERLALTPQHSLHLVSVGDRTMLIAASPGGCAVLGGLSPETGEERTVR
jgi:flagellar biogenesis protein FliO